MSYAGQGDKMETKPQLTGVCSMPLLCASDILNRLAMRWGGNGYVRVRELRPSVGYKGEERRIDLWVIECRPSAGMPAHAVEIKVSRGDWLRELKQPMKRRAAMAISNFFWIAAPKGIVKPEELPSDCGLIEFKAETEAWDHGEITVPANYRDKVRCSWGLMASVLRNVTKNT